MSIIQDVIYSPCIIFVRLLIAFISAQIDYMITGCSHFDNARLTCHRKSMFCEWDPKVYGSLGSSKVLSPRHCWNWLQQFFIGPAGGHNPHSLALTKQGSKARNPSTASLGQNRVYIYIYIYKLTSKFYSNLCKRKWLETHYKDNFTFNFYKYILPHGGLHSQELQCSTHLIISNTSSFAGRHPPPPPHSTPSSFQEPAYTRFIKSEG